MLGQKMTNKEYREHMGVSKSSLAHIAKSPMHYKYYLEHPREDTPALLFGRAVHKYILEKDEFFSEFAIKPNVDARTKAGKEEIAAFMETEKGKDIITAEMFDTIKEMDAVVTSNKYASALLNGEKESSFFWNDDETGEPCKCRPDCLTEIGGQKIIVDYKTTDDAETEAFRRSAINYSYDLQAGMYSEGMEKVTGEQYLFLFVAQEKKPPYAVNIVQADDFFVKEGKQLFHDLLGILHECHEKDCFPGYMGFDEEIGNLSLPKWLQKAVEEQ